MRIWLAWAVVLATWAWTWTGPPSGRWVVLWPSTVAIALAFLTRQIQISLLAGAFTGAVLVQQGDPAAAAADLFARYLLPALQSEWNLSVLIFTLLMGGLVEVLNRNGGMQALAEKVLGRARQPRRAAWSAYAMGWLVFFDGLANAMVVGKTLRPAADRAGLSREKLAFVVDSTSSPIAGIALISTWVAYEISVIRQGLENAGNPAILAEAAPYGLLVESLPFRFYNYFMLWMVALTIWLARDFGPMHRTEARARRSPARGGEASEMTGTGATGKQAARMMLALVPLALLVAGVFGGLYVQGGGLEGPLTMERVIDAFGKADAARVFVYATAVSALSAVLLSMGSATRGCRPVEALLAGVNQMFAPALILVLAWMLNGVIQELGTAAYVVGWIEPQWPAGWLPALVFLASALVSFSTGTSWGTMALVMPLAIPLAVHWTGWTGSGEAHGLVLAVIGAVLAGAVFGDHCSPISDTTIVSAFSCDCDVMAHVRTQLPYALVAAGAAAAIGYGPAGWGAPAWLLLAIGGLACWAAVRYWGRRYDER